MDNTDFLAAKDRVRERLNKFTVKAFQMVPKMDNPRILDVGCGSGVPTLKLAELSNGHITALDIDQNAIDSLKRKIAESGLPGYDISSWFGLFAPAGTPAAIVNLLQAEVARAITTKAVVDRLPDYLLIANTPAEFAAFLRKDAELAARIIAQSGAKSD